MFDLDITEDPAWFYLDSQYEWIVGLLKNTFEASVKKIQALQLGDTEESDIKRSIILKKAIHQVQTKTLDANTGKLEVGTDDMRTESLKLLSERDQDAQVWQLMLEMVKSLSALLLRCLPDFWRLSKAFIEGKFANKVRHRKSLH